MNKNIKKFERLAFFVLLFLFVNTIMNDGFWEPIFIWCVAGLVAFSVFLRMDGHLRLEPAVVALAIIFAVLGFIMLLCFVCISEPKKESIPAKRQMQ